MSAPTATLRREKMTRAQQLEVLGRYGVLLPFLIVLIVCSVAVPHFLTAHNIGNMLVNAAALAVIGIGMTIVVALRGLDLSVGSTLGLAACTTALVTNAYGVVPGVLAGLGVGVAIGVVNGVVVSVLRVPAFVATLGTKGVILGLALIVMHGQTVQVTDATFASFSTSSLGPFPVPFLTVVVLLIAGYLLIGHTPYGRHLIAVGGNPEAASDSGIRVRRVTFIAYVLCGLSAAIAGVMLLSQIGTASGTLGQGIELQVIAITVLGGSSLSGGTANLVGTAIAALMLAFVDASLNLINVSPFYQYLAVGVILLLALATDSLRRSLQRAALISGGS
jgi:ribose/xylose/arabinose/galactoside ABC-type transport system permease subunit